MNDPRHNAPSASGYGRLLNCPASWALEQICPNEETEDSKAGTRMHAALAGELDPAELPLLERARVEQCQALLDKAVEQWGCRNTDAENAAAEVIREERIRMLEGFKVVFSGQPDYVRLCGRRALVLDYKTLWGEQEPSNQNAQLRALAVLVRWQHDWGCMEQVTVGIVQPNETLQLATFDREALDAARAEVDEALQAYKQPSEPVLGDWCKFCRAKVICPKQKERAAWFAKLHADSIRRQELTSNDDLFELLSICCLMKKMAGEIEAEAKRRLEAGATLARDGIAYALEETRGKRKIKDNALLLNQLPQCDATEILIECATIRISDLEALIRAKNGAKVAETKAWMEKHLTCISAGEASTRLEKVRQLT